MAITVIFSNAEKTTLVRTVGHIAANLGQHEPMRVILRDGGTLFPWLEERLGAQPMSLCNRGNFPYDAPFADRVAAAATFFSDDPGDVVYICGVTASDFAAAAKVDGRRVILHAQDDIADLENLLKRDLTKIEIVSFCDALVLEEWRLQSDWGRVFGELPTPTIVFGPKIDVDAVSRLARGEPAPAYSAKGGELKWNKRFVVGTCADAAPDMTGFFPRLARQCPELDFVWLGPRSTADIPQHKVAAVQVDENFYIANCLSNPYPSLAKLDLYCSWPRVNRDLSIVLEAAALGVPILGFSERRTAEFLGRNAILYHAEPELSDVARILRAIAADRVAAGMLSPSAKTIRARVDITANANSVVALIADLRFEDWRRKLPFTA